MQALGRRPLAARPVASVLSKRALCGVPLSRCSVRGVARVARVAIPAGRPAPLCLASASSSSSSSSWLEPSSSEPAAASRPRSVLARLAAAGEAGIPSEPPSTRERLHALAQLAWARVFRPLRDFGFGRRNIWEGGVGLFLVGGFGALPSRPPPHRRTRAPSGNHTQMARTARARHPPRAQCHPMVTLR